LIYCIVPSYRINISFTDFPSHSLRCFKNSYDRYLSFCEIDVWSFDAGGVKCEDDRAFDVAALVGVVTFEGEAVEPISVTIPAATVVHPSRRVKRPNCL
jgi:hypothetical protein